MSSASKAWIVAASIGAVEALKDQMGVCWWNYTMRLVQQQAQKNIKSFAQLKNLSSSSSVLIVGSNRLGRDEQKMKQSEESLRKVMYLSCWGPN